MVLVAVGGLQAAGGGCASTRVAEIGSIAMPVIGTTGTAVAAITISAVESRFDPDRRASIVAAMNEHIGVLQRQFIV